MTTKEAQDTIRQMLADWDNLTDEQRAEAQASAAKQAAEWAACEVDFCVLMAGHDGLHARNA